MIHRYCVLTETSREEKTHLGGVGGGDKRHVKVMMSGSHVTSPVGLTDQKGVNQTSNQFN